MKCQLKVPVTLKDRDYTVVNMSEGSNLAGHSRVLSTMQGEAMTETSSQGRKEKETDLH